MNYDELDEEISKDKSLLDDENMNLFSNKNQNF